MHESDTPADGSPRPLVQRVRTTAAYWFECAFCTKSWQYHDLNKLRRAAANHLNEEHAKDLRRTHDLVETEQRDGYHLEDNRYVMERVPIYVTPFDILQPAERPWEYVHPQDTDSVCESCGRRMNHTWPDEVQVELAPDDPVRDDWQCIVCEHDALQEDRAETHKQLQEYV